MNGVERFRVCLIFAAQEIEQAGRPAWFRDWRRFGRGRTTVPLCTSLSPTTSMYGIFALFRFADLEPDLLIADIRFDTESVPLEFA